MKKHLGIAITSISILAASLGAAIDARAQTPAPVRKPITESSIKLPEYFGLYAVQKSGEVLDLKLKNQSVAPAAPLCLPEDVEFLIYGKDIDPSEFHLELAEIEKGNALRKIELLAKPVSNQTQMLRLIPASSLPNGPYTFFHQGMLHVEVSYFYVGPMPVDPSAKENPPLQSSAKHDLTDVLIGNGMVSLFGDVSISVSIDGQTPVNYKSDEYRNVALEIGTRHSATAVFRGKTSVKNFVVTGPGTKITFHPPDFQ